jgi:hypothetical protein
VTIKRDINALIPPKARGKKRLAPLAGNRSIKASRGVGKPAAAATANGIASPLTEIAGSRTFHTTERELRSSDGLFVVSYYNIKQLRMRDAASSEVVFIYDDYTAS